MTLVYSVSSDYEYGEAYSFHGVFSSPEKVDKFIQQEVNNARPVRSEIHGSAAEDLYRIASIGSRYYYVEVCTLDVPVK